MVPPYIAVAVPSSAVAVCFDVCSITIGAGGLGTSSASSVPTSGGRSSVVGAALSLTALGGGNGESTNPLTAVVTLPTNGGGGSAYPGACYSWAPGFCGGTSLLQGGGGGAGSGGRGFGGGCYWYDAFVSTGNTSYCYTTGVDSSGPFTNQVDGGQGGAPAAVSLRPAINLTLYLGAGGGGGAFAFTPALDPLPVTPPTRFGGVGGGVSLNGSYLSYLRLGGTGGGISTGDVPGNSILTALPNTGSGGGGGGGIDPNNGFPRIARGTGGSSGTCYFVLGF